MVATSIAEECPIQQQKIECAKIHSATLLRSNTKENSFFKWKCKSMYTSSMFQTLLRSYPAQAVQEAVPFNEAVPYFIPFGNKRIALEETKSSSAVVCLDCFFTYVMQQTGVN